LSTPLTILLFLVVFFLSAVWAQFPETPGQCVGDHCVNNRFVLANTIGLVILTLFDIYMTFLAKCGARDGMAAPARQFLSCVGTAAIACMCCFTGCLFFIAILMVAISSAVHDDHIGLADFWQIFWTGRLLSLFAWIFPLGILHFQAARYCEEEEDPIDLWTGETATQTMHDVGGVELPPVDPVAPPTMGQPPAGQLQPPGAAQSAAGSGAAAAGTAPARGAFQ